MLKATKKDLCLSVNITVFGGFLLVNNLFYYACRLFTIYTYKAFNVTFINENLKLTSNSYTPQRLFISCSYRKYVFH